MSWVYEIALRGEPHQAEALRKWFEDGIRAAYAGLPGLASFDLYMPDAGTSRDPYNNHSSGPLMLLMLDFVSRDALAKATASGAIAAPVRGRALRAALGVAATGEAFARRFFPVGEGYESGPARSPVLLCGALSSSG